MIKPEELRIGNYVKRRDLASKFFRMEKVLEISKKALTSGPINVLCDYEELEPIEINEELLLRLGFEESGTMYWKQRLGDVSIDVAFYDCWIILISGIGLDIEYKGYPMLHELQNLISITGKELQLKPREESGVYGRPDWVDEI